MGINSGRVVSPGNGYNIKCLGESACLPASQGPLSTGTILVVGSGMREQEGTR